MDLLCWILLGLLGCVVFSLVLFLVLEIHYFLRVLLCLILAGFKKRVHILDETRVYGPLWPIILNRTSWQVTSRLKGICLPTDIDQYLNHMNNARFMRELDFAKIDFNIRTGLYGKIRKYGGSILMAATTIRYRKLIKIFHRYYITTKIIYWDDQHIYMEHRFVTPDDNFINAIIMCKTRLTKCNAEEVLKDLLVKKSDCDIEISKMQKPDLPLELAKWIESNEISSTILRGDVTKF